MTLIAGFRCMDGYVIAADTEITWGTVRLQGHKLVEAALDSPHPFCIAVAGNMGVGMMAAQKVRDAFLSLHVPANLPDFRKCIEDILLAVYDRHVLKEWHLVGVDQPSFSLVIGVEDSTGKFAVFQTEINAVYEVDFCAFAGSGETTAAYIFERWSNANPLTAAATCHLAQQLFREVKAKGIYVGGNTEVRGRRSTKDAQRFFDLPSLQDERELWGMDDILLSAVRDALSPRFHAFPGRKISNQVNDRIKLIRKALTNLYSDSHNEKNVHSDGERDYYLTEFGSHVGSPFKDF